MHNQAQDAPPLLLHSPYLQVCYAENRGRYLIAKQDIPKDTLIFSTTAYATNILESFKKRLCFTCLKYNEKGRYDLHCRDCAQVYFCSIECKDNFSATHADECECLRKLWSSRFGLHIVSVLNLAIFILKRRSFEILGIGNTINIYSSYSNSTNPVPAADTNSNNTPNNDSLILETQLESNASNLSEMSLDSGAPYPQTQTINNSLPTQHGSTHTIQAEPTETTALHSPTNANASDAQVQPIQPIDAMPEEPVDANSQYELSHFPAFCDVALLAEHHESIPDYDINYYRRGINLMKNSLRGALYECNKDLLNDDALLRIVSKIESNGFGVWKDQICMGRALYPFASFFNHSCDPNCITRQLHGCLYIYTTVDVNKDEELCISYIDSNLPRCNRQLTLQRDYYFACCCLRCEKEKLEPPKAQKYSYSRSINNSLKGKKGEKKREDKKNEKKKSLKKSNDTLEDPTSNCIENETVIL